MAVKTIVRSRYDLRMDIDALQQRLAEFAAERDWEQFHSPKNLAMALAAEAGELVEVFQWLTETESANLDATQKQLAAHELADVLIYLVRLADRLEIDLDAVVTDKIRINAEKYPVELAKGSAAKSNRRD
jgi:NTP pyrophosphatase (non-canonical NTP hydrolase)